jgi:RHS repeat-associated protein
LLKHLELFSAPDCSLHALWRGQATEENAVVETSDYRSAAETRRNPLLEGRRAIPLACLERRSYGEPALLKSGVEPSEGGQMPGKKYLTNANTTKEGFTGKERDKHSGLDYFGARYYDAGIGKWLSVDPLAHQYYSISSYTYCANNPVIFTDPNGMELQGDSTQLADLAADANNALEEAGIDDATVTVESKEQEKTGLSALFASVVNALGGNVSTTETVFYLATSGSGWDNINTGNAWKDFGFSGLNDLLNSPTVFELDVSDDAGGRLSLGELSGNVIHMFPRDYFERENQDFFAVFMHEFVGHGHPDSPNSLETVKQGANNIGRAFGRAGWHNHDAKRSKKPGGGYSGYPVVLP